METTPHTHKQSHVLEHTLHGIAETLERGLFAEEISLRKGLFQSLDPRVKVVSVLALLLGEIDLSAGVVSGLCAAVMAVLNVKMGVPGPLAVLIGVGIGTLIGLFQGMFEKNMLTFNPGWDSNGQNLASFTDVRELQRQLKAKGVKLQKEADENSTGPASFVAIDPDGNPILVDQHR